MSWPNFSAGRSFLQGNEQRSMEKTILEELKTIKEQNCMTEKAIKQVVQGCERLEERISDVEKALKQQQVKSSTDIPMQIIQDAFDGDMKDQLETLYKSVSWSEVDDDVKEELKEKLEYSLLAQDMDVPSSKELFKRIKGFYGNRRSQALTKSDPEKKLKRKVELKQSRMTYIAREKAVHDAVEQGLVDITNSKDVNKIRKSVPPVCIDLVSPPQSPRTLNKKRLILLKKAREEKGKKKRSSESHSTPPQQTSSSYTTRNILDKSAPSTSGTSPVLFTNHSTPSRNFSSSTSIKKTLNKSTQPISRASSLAVRNMLHHSTPSTSNSISSSTTKNITKSSRSNTSSALLTRNMWNHSPPTSSKNLGQYSSTLKSMRPSLSTAPKRRRTHQILESSDDEDERHEEENLTILAPDSMEDLEDPEETQLGPEHYEPYESLQ